MENNEINAMDSVCGDLEDFFDKKIEKHGADVIWSGMFYPNRPIFVTMERIKRKVEKAHNHIRILQENENRARIEKQRKEREDAEAAERIKARKEEKVLEALANERKCKEEEELLAEYYKK